MHNIKFRAEKDSYLKHNAYKKQQRYYFTMTKQGFPK